MNQHKKEDEYQETNSKFAKHVQATNLEINWKEVKCLEREGRMYPREIIESQYIKFKGNTSIMNMTEGIRISGCYDKVWM